MLCKEIYMENRTRIIFVLKYLIDNSNINHPCSGNSIIEAYYNNFGQSATLKTIYQDISDLISSGFDIKRKRRGFYIENVLFSISQLYLISEMINDNGYLKINERNLLIEKLFNLTNKYDREILQKRSLSIENNETPIINNIDILLQAIAQKCLVSFRYYDLGIKKEKMYRHHLYQLYPLDIVISNSQCYLIGYQKKYNSINKYRVEKIEKIILQPDKKITIDYDRKEYLKKNFSMYQGEIVNVNLYCKKGFLDYLYNQFEQEIIISKQLEQGYICNISLPLTVTFFSTIFSFDGNITIISPQNVKDQFIQYCHKMIEIHQ